MVRWVTLAVMGLTCTLAQAADRRVDATTLSGKMIFGYQGWFSCPPNPGGWGHWGNLDRGTVTVDMLPDVSELSSADRCKSPMKTHSGQPVDLYDPGNPAVAEMHLSWMEHYGLDGVALQRFATDLINSGVMKSRNIVLQNIRGGGRSRQSLLHNVRPDRDGCV